MRAALSQIWGYITVGIFLGIGMAIGLEVYGMATRMIHNAVYYSVIEWKKSPNAL